MNKNDVINFAKENGQPIARSSMKAGNYIGEKVTDDYRIIGKINDKWIPIEKQTKVDTYLVFSMVNNLKTGLPVNISVPLEFTELSVKTKFPFTVNEKGYTSVSLEKLTDKQVKQLLSEAIE